jgi:hypothetical protein
LTLDLGSLLLSGVGVQVEMGPVVLFQRDRDLACRSRLWEQDGRGVLVVAVVPVGIPERLAPEVRHKPGIPDVEHDRSYAEDPSIVGRGRVLAGQRQLVWIEKRS